jgi:hypothetical protein
MLAALALARRDIHHRFLFGCFLAGYSSFTAFLWRHALVRIAAQLPAGALSVLGKQ